MPNEEIENNSKDNTAVKDDAASASRDVETSAADMFRSESLGSMQKESSSKSARPNEEPAQLDFGPAANAEQKAGLGLGLGAERTDKADKADQVQKPEREKDPFSELQRQMQEQREKEQQENINKIVESVSKDGKLPDNIKDMLRDFEPRSYAGFHGDADGLKNYVDQINQKLREQGSQYSLDVTQLQQSADPRRGGFGGGAYSSWTDNHVSVRDNLSGRVTDRVTVVTDPIAKPGVRF